MRQSIVVPVCILCQSFATNIQDIGVNEYKFANCQPQECMRSGKFNLMHQEIKSLFDETEIINDEMHIQTSKNESWAEMFTYNIIGKTLMHQDNNQKDVLYYQYDVAKQILVTKYPMCVFEKQIYTMLLVITIVIILAALTIGIINLKKHEINAYSKIPAVEQEYTHSQIPRYSMSHIRKSFKPSVVHP